jgi:hypothetical protein
VTTARWLALGAAIAAGGCGGDRPFVRADAPVARDSVTVSLAGQQCRRRTRRDQNDILDLVLAVRVTNGAPAPLSVVPARLRLVVRGDAALPEEHGDALPLAPGQSADVRVHYRPWNSGGCNQPMSLSAGGALELEGHPLELPDLTFVPEASDT